MNCYCHSGKKYEECCQPYHKGEALPSNAQHLMRARYAAYAIGDADFIIHTTHSKNKSYLSDFNKWRLEILQFSNGTQFQGLEITEFKESEKEAYVTFSAHLMQNGNNASFTEKSRFEKVDGVWLYHSAVYTRSLF